MEGNSIKSLEGLCKIFEMRIKLDKEKGIRTSSEVIDTYEKYSKKIDSEYNKEFEKFKVFFNFTLVTVALILLLIFTQQIEGVREDS